MQTLNKNAITTQFGSSQMIKAANIKAAPSSKLLCQRVVASSSGASTEDRRSNIIRHFAATAAALQIIALPAQAYWDGESSGRGSCPLGDAGVECRTNLLAKDAKKGLGSYNSKVDNATKVSGKVGGVPVSEMTGPYAMETLALGDAMLKYAELDLYDPARVDLIKTLKKEGQDWVSKYARGGSARTTSARKLYIAVDGILGHLASNG